MTEDIRAHLPEGEATRLEALIAQDKKDKADELAKKEKEAEQKAELLAKRALLLQSNSSPSAGGVGPVGESQRIAKKMMGSKGWNSAEFGCLVKLWNKESGWNHRAANPSSGAYGIPQSLPGSKMASAGSDWKTNPSTQIKWGLGYIEGRYKTPCSAWAHSVNVGWY